MIESGPGPVRQSTQPLEMRTFASFLIIAFLFGCQKSEKDLGSASYEEFFNYGPHEVGFMTLFAIDRSREHVPYSDWSGRLYPEENTTEGRLLPIHIWYPSSQGGKRLDYGYLVQLITTHSDQTANKSSDSLARAVYIRQTNDLGGAGSFNSEKLNTLLDLTTNTSLEASPAEGKFPLVIFPNGSSPAYQSIMSEYLASHGFVVAGLSLKGQFSSVMDSSVRGLEYGVDDLEFALQQLVGLEYVDGSRIALIGNAMASSVSTALASRNKKIKALVSLEGGLLSNYEQEILNETQFYAPENVTIPILAIYAPHPAISPDYIYPLKYSDRYFAHFPEMSEFHFLNYGVFEKYVPGIIGEARGDTPKGFSVGSELILHFLEAHLKDNSTPLNAVFSDPAPIYEKGVIDTLFRKEGIPAPPNITILKDLFIRKGMTAIDSVYQANRRENNLQPFSQSFYLDFKNWLAWKKDPDYIYRKRLFELAIDSYPESALNHYYLANYLNRTGNEEKSRTHYQRSLELLDSDAEIDAELKSELVESIRTALE